MTTKHPSSPTNPASNGAAEPLLTLTTRSAVILLSAVLVGVACAGLTVLARHPLADGVLAGAAAAVASTRLFHKLIQ